MTGTPKPAAAESLLTHLECSECARRAPAEAFGPCPVCGAPLLCRYDLSHFPEGAWANPAARGEAGVFTWAELLPVRRPELRLSLGEGRTPTVELPALATELGLASLHVKDEAANPGGSFKARGLAVSLAAHVERGATAVVLPSAGNAGGAAALYARRHGIPSRVILPTGANATFRAEERLVGARVIAVSGDLGEAGAWLRAHVPPEGDHVIATFHEPFRVEGKKSMAYELWQRFGDELPDAIVYPTGGGTGLVAMHAAFAQLRELGLLKGAAPRLIAAQVETCAPVVRAFDAGSESVEPWERTHRTLAEGLRVPRLAGGRLVLRALRESGGAAHAVAEAEAVDAIRKAARSDGMLLCAEGGVAMATLLALRRKGELEGARVLVFNTASIYKSPETLAAASSG